MIMKKGKNNMYVSGSLKDKTINFYKAKINSFDEQGINTSHMSIEYDGHLIFPPWEQTLEQKLKIRQEKLISTEQEKTVLFSKMKYSFLKREINKILAMILSTNRKHTYALLECFYKLIMTSDHTSEIKNRLDELRDLISYIEAEEFNQIEIDLLLKLFLSKKEWNHTMLTQAKEETFHIKEDEILSESLTNLITFGEFASPTRVPKIANTLASDIEYSKMILPLYFAIPDEVTANKFLTLCRKPDLDIEQIKRNASKLNIPESVNKFV